MADSKWGGIAVWAQELWENPCGREAFEAELRRRVEPLLTAAEKCLQWKGDKNGELRKELATWQSK